MTPTWIARAVPNAEKRTKFLTFNRQREIF
jgi:hypothetical protein